MIDWDGKKVRAASRFQKNIRRKLKKSTSRVRSAKFVYFFFVLSLSFVS